jgi:hypothetical protein
MGGVAFREDVFDLVGPSALVLHNPVVNIDHYHSPLSLVAADNMRGATVALSGPAALWAPDKHLCTKLIDHSQGIWLLWHVQGLKERPGSYFCIVHALHTVTLKGCV